MSELVLEKESNLPQGWNAAKLIDICDIKGRVGWKGYKKSDLRQKGIYVIGGEHIDKNDNLDFSKPKFISEEKYLESPEIMVKPNDIILSHTGSIGKIAIVTKGLGKITINPNVLLIKNIQINHYFLYYFFRSPLFQNLLFEGDSSSTIPTITQKFLKAQNLLIPPLNEQKRIAEKIEELFSELNEINNLLENTKLQLKQYHKLLLKFSFEGKLTEKWRKSNKANLDSLLKKIELGRKSQSKKLQNIENPKNEEFFKIPNEWKWISVGVISKEIQYGTSDKATITKSKFPVLRMGNIQDGELNFDNLKYYPDNWEKSKQFFLDTGDVLFNRTNSAELVGKTAVYRDFYPNAVFAGYLIRVKIIEETYIPSLLSYYINSIFGQEYVRSVVSQQVGQANVNATKLSLMPIPLMSFEEQKEIISQLELNFSIIKKTENIINFMLKRVDTLRSSILKQAFKGKLIPQDPNDETSEILLHKIKQEKEQLKLKEKKPRRKKNAR